MRGKPKQKSSGFVRKWDFVLETKCCTGEQIEERRRLRRGENRARQKEREGARQAIRLIPSKK